MQLDQDGDVDHPYYEVRRWGKSIAVVTASYNEPHKLRSWRENYETYAHDVALHIIVDDGSEPEYLDQVRRTFPASTILAHAQNRGLVAAYNTGFQFALQAGAAYIGPVAPDMRLMTDCLPRLRNALRADSTIGVVGPVWLQRGTQNTVEEIGGEAAQGSCFGPQVWSRQYLDARLAWRGLCKFCLWGSAPGTARSV